MIVADCLNNTRCCCPRKSNSINTQAFQDRPNQSLKAFTRWYQGTACSLKASGSASLLADMKRGSNAADSRCGERQVLCGDQHVILVKVGASSRSGLPRPSISAPPEARRMTDDVQEHFRHLRTILPQHLHRRIDSTLLLTCSHLRCPLLTFALAVFEQVVTL
jgi:hypothetical protein